MRLFGYYAFHSFINQIRKLMKTWVLIFLVACMLVGGLIGLIFAKLDDETSTPDEITYESTDAIDEAYEEEDSGIIVLLEENGIDTSGTALLELAAGLVVLLIFVYDILSTDKNASRLFLPADVNTLFSSPMKPQSVLMFRIAMQMAIALFLTVYFFIEIPVLTDLFDMRPIDSMFLVISWGLTFLFAKLIQVFLYLLYADHPAAKKWVPYGVYGVVLLAGTGFYFYWKSSGELIGKAASEYFCSTPSRFIPVWGQLKALAVYSANGDIAFLVVSSAAIVLLMALLLFIISCMKGDYYEDAIQKSEEVAEALKKAQESKKLVVSTNKKNFSDGLVRNEFHYGNGANVFFFKSMYNRFRFAKLHVFTKTMITYIAVAVIVSLGLIFIFEKREFYIAAAIFGAFVFYRSLGNPLEEDTTMDYFRLIPESAASKLFYSVLAGSTNCLMDLIPGYLIAAVALAADPMLAILGIFVIVSLDFYSTTTAAFINLSVPVQAGKMVKQMVQVMFIYFGMLPDLIALIVGVALGMMPLALIMLIVINILLGTLFFCLASLFTQ